MFFLKKKEQSNEEDEKRTRFDFTLINRFSCLTEFNSRRMGDARNALERFLFTQISI